MRLRFVSAGTVVSLLCAAGCSLVTSYDGFTGSAPDAGPAVDAALTPEQTLCLPDIPSQPSITKPLINDALTYTGVVNQLRFLAEDGGCPLGKNLDGISTCPGPAACADLRQDPAADAAAAHCDFAGGIDNASQGDLLNASFNGQSKFDLASELPQDLAAQRTGFVLTLSAYGGDLDDPQVNVAYYVDVGTADGGTITDQAAVSHGHILTEASLAYVSNGVLVAHFDTVNGDGGTEQVPLHFSVMLENQPGLSSLTIPISNATLLGIPRLDPDGGLTMTNAQLVGRLRSADLVTELSSLYGCLTTSDALSVCAQFDLTDSPGTDGKGPVCDAISLAVGFDLVPTVIVGSAPAIPSTDFCALNDMPVATDICGANPVPDAGGDDAAGDDDGGDADSAAADAGP